MPTTAEELDATPSQADTTADKFDEFAQAENVDDSSVGFEPLEERTVAPQSKAAEEASEDVEPADADRLPDAEELAAEDQAAVERAAEELAAEELAADDSSIELQNEPIAAADETETEGTADASTDSSGADVSHLEVPAFDPKLLRRRKLQHAKRRILSALANHKASLIASAASLLVGFLCSYFFAGGDGDAPQTAALDSQMTFVATTLRRSEPLTTVAPFEGLDPNVVGIGQRLFHDSSLSGTGKISCVNCHRLEPVKDTDSLRPSALTTNVLQRDIPAVFNAPLNFRLGWDGSYESLESFLDDHFSKDGYMASDWERVLKVVREDPLYFRSFQLHMDEEPNEKLVRTALATYERSLVRVNAPFDQWLMGNEQALSSDAIAGYYLFKQLNCIACHQGAGVGGSMLKPIDALLDTLSPEAKNDLGLFTTTGRERDKYVFRVPSLRNVAQTAPYFHDGSVSKLEKAVELMMQQQLGLEPNPIEVDRITAFLQSLTGQALEEVQSTSELQQQVD